MESPFSGRFSKFILGQQGVSAGRAGAGQDAPVPGFSKGRPCFEKLAEAALGPERVEGESLSWDVVGGFGCKDKEKWTQEKADKQGKESKKEKAGKRDEKFKEHEKSKQDKGGK